MAYSTLPTVNPGDVLSSSLWGNQAKANEDWLFSGKAVASSAVNKQTTWTTTSASYVDIDATFLGATLTITTGRMGLACGLWIGQSNSGTSGQITLLLDGVDQGSASGIAKVLTNSSGYVTIYTIFTGLSVGSHTVKLQFKDTGGGTLTVNNTFSNSGVMGAFFTAWEA